jgi:hypothetical protein
MFENNSDKARHSGEKPKMEQIVQNTEVKKSLKNKFKETFTNEDSRSITEWIVMDVVVPKIKEAVVNSITGSLNMLFYGDPNKSTINGKTNYSRINTSTNRTTRREYNRPSKPDISEVAFNSRVDALRVLDALEDRIEQYDCCTVADFYEAVGIEPGHSDYKYGWLDLEKAYVSAYGSQYYIEFPKSRLIE